MVTISVDTGEIPITVFFDDHLYLKYSGYQRGGGLRATYSGSDWPQRLNKIWNDDFNKIRKLGAFDLPDNPSIVDVGCGVGTLSLLLSKYLKNPKFFLIDKSLHNHTIGNIDYQSLNNKHGFYNTWEPLKSAISLNELDLSLFSMNDTDASWPENVDLIISTFSWCWHYSKDVYWNNVMSSLKYLGKLQLDVSNWPNRDIVGEISEELKCKPVISPIAEYPHPAPGAWTIDENKNRGYSCMWIKKNK